MFRRLPLQLPEDPVFPKTLSELGLHLTDDLQFIDDTTGKHFENFVTDNEHYNAVRKEAVHAAARVEMIKQAVNEGLQEVFIYGDGTELGESRPEGPHVDILTTKLEQLKEKDDVIILVGEHTQDLGVFAYRSFMRTPGMNGASAVGLVKQIREMYLMKESAIKGLTSSISPHTAQNERTTQADLETPGLVILNPGQLCYSPMLNTNMTMASWRDRRRRLATDSAFQIDDTFNRLQGHKTAEEHLAVTFDSILPKLLKSTAKMYLIGIADGANNLIEFLDSRSELIENGKIQAAFFAQPVSASINSGVLEQFLAVHGRSWISSEKERGSLLQVPEHSSRALDWGNISSTTGSSTNNQHSMSSSASNHVPASEPGAIAPDMPPGPNDEPEDPEHSDPVLCPTFSCGFTSVSEVIFPAVMGEAIGFILGRMEQVHTTNVRAVDESVEVAMVVDLSHSARS